MATDSPANRTVGSISACVPTTRGSSPDWSLASNSRRRAAGVEPVSRPGRGSGAGEQAPRAWRSAARRMFRSAPSAPPAGPTRAREASRRGPRRSCLSRPLPSAAAASAGPTRDPHRPRRTPGADRRSARTADRRATNRPDHRMARAARGYEPRAALTPANLQSGLMEEQVPHRRGGGGPRPRPPCSPGNEPRRAHRPHPDSPRRTRTSAGRGSSTCQRLGQRRPDPLPDPLDAQPLPRRMNGDDAAGMQPGRWSGLIADRIVSHPARGSGNRESRMRRVRNPPSSRRPLSKSRTPGLRRSASQAWLNHVTFIDADPSVTVASTMLRLRRRVGRSRALRTSATTVAGSPIRSTAISVADERSP